MSNISRKLEFDKLHNIRDLGGMKNRDGSVIKQGCFIRAGHLSELSDDDREKLKENVRTVIDFRTEQERSEKPDIELESISYIHNPIMDNLTAGVTREKDADKKIFATLAQKPTEAKKYMCKMYRGFVEDFAVSQYSKFIQSLIKPHEGAVLWHCTAGKDRAGIASVIVEEILGIPREDIIADYMSTNKYLEKDIAFLTGFVKKQLGTDSDLADEAFRYLFGAEEEYIQAYYDAVEEKYGDFETFIHKGLGLSDGDIDELRKQYLQSAF